MAGTRSDGSRVLAELCDAQLESMTWCEDGRDIEFSFSRGVAGDHPPLFVVLRLTWAQGLDVRLSNPPAHGGRLLIWEASVRDADGEASIVLFDFAGAGHIRVGCNEVLWSAADPAHRSVPERD